MWYSTLEDAYSALRLHNGASLADEDIGVAYYRERPSGRGALEFIATARKSRFLLFLATIGEHLNEKNVAVLAKKTFAAPPEPGNLGEDSASAISKNEAAASGNFPPDTARESCESEMDMDAFGEYYAASEDIPFQPISPSSPEASFSSSDGMNVDSDFSEEVCGVYFDPFRSTWQCEECNTALVDGDCPNGHKLSHCQTCGWQLDNGSCQKCIDMCGACGAERVSEGSEEEDTIAFDEGEGLWRCIHCHWEIEADNHTDGNRHCLNDDGDAHFIDLTDCPDYEPADSCSSEDEPTDSEPNGDDEDFLDDTEICMDAIALDAAKGTVDLAALYSASELPDNIKAAEVVEDTKLARDMESIDPIGRLVDIEHVDAAITYGPPQSPSNIIDCKERALICEDVSCSGFFRARPMDLCCVGILEL